jgi:hypothetical protein
VPTVVASTAAAAEEAMKTRDLAFASRPRLLMADRLYYGLDGDGGGGGGGGTKLRKQVFGEFEELLGTVPMAEVVPWLWPVDVATGLQRKARRTSEEIDRLLERVIADHRRRRRGARRVVGGGEVQDDRRDFVDVLLDLSEAEEEIGGVQLDTITIKATILVCLLLIYLVYVLRNEHEHSNSDIWMEFDEKTMHDLHIGHARCRH